MALKERRNGADPAYGIVLGNSASIQPMDDIGDTLRAGSRDIFGHKAGFCE